MIIENVHIRRFNISQRGEITKASIFLQVMICCRLVNEKKRIKEENIYIMAQLALLYVVVNISPNL